MNKQYLSLLLLLSFVTPFVQSSSVIIPGAFVAAGKAAAGVTYSAALAAKQVTQNAAALAAETTANANFAKLTGNAADFAAQGVYNTAAFGKHVVTGEGMPGKISAFEAGLSALGKQFVKLGNYPKTFLGGSTVVAAGTSAGTFAAAQDLAQSPVVSAPVVDANFGVKHIMTAEEFASTPQELTRLMEVEVAQQKAAFDAARESAVSGRHVITKEEYIGDKSVSMTDKIRNFFMDNKTGLTKGAVAGATGLTTGLATYYAMKKIDKTSKTTNAVTAGVVGAATTAGTFVKYDALSSALSSIKTPTFVTSTVDFVKPGFSYVGNAVMNNKVVAGTVVGAAVLGGLAYAFRNKLANMLSTSQSNTVEQNEGLLVSLKTELAFVNKQLGTARISASNLACSNLYPDAQATVTSLESRQATLVKQIADVNVTIKTQQEVGAAA